MIASLLTEVRLLCQLVFLSGLLLVELITVAWLGTYLYTKYVRPFFRRMRRLHPPKSP